MLLSTLLPVVPLMALTVSAAPEIYDRKPKKDVCCSGLLNCVVVVGDACPSGNEHYKCDADTVVSDNSAMIILC